MPVVPPAKSRKILSRVHSRDKSFKKGVLKTIFNSPTVSDKDVEKLNFLQATKLIGSLPATEKQIEAVKNLVAEKRIESLESYDLSAADASRILDKAYRDGTERDPNGPGRLPARKKH